MIFRINSLHFSRLNKVYICCFGRCDSGYFISFGIIGSYPWNDMIF